jgi:hypothetical protein
MAGAAGSSLLLNTLIAPAGPGTPALAKSRIDSDLEWLLFRPLRVATSICVSSTRSAGAAPQQKHARACAAAFFLTPPFFLRLC